MKSKRGFTLIELLAVIVILAVIALIVTPVVSNIISSAKEATFKEAVNNLLSASSNYLSKYLIDHNGKEPSYSIIFICNGTSCTNSLGDSLDISGSIPKSGRIVIENSNDIYAEVISDGVYYASGTKGNLNISKDVTLLDDYSGLENNQISISLILENSKYDYTSKIEDLGVPLNTRYPGTSDNDILSRNVWDMKLYDNKIYIGSGDYDKNTGPVDIYYYDISNNKFVKEATVDDEQINRFVIANGKLTIPGIDRHTGAWDFGYYYVLENGTWVSKKIKDAIHNFEIVEYKGALYAGIGNDSDSSILKSTDDGTTWEYVYMYDINGNKITVTEANSRNTRVYDMFVFNNKLYAISNYKIFEYIDESNTFVQIDSNYSYFFGTSPALQYFSLKEKIVFKDKIVFVNGMLTYLDSIGNHSLTSLFYDKTSSAVDLVEKDGNLYVLSNTIYNGEVYISVYKTKDAVKWKPLMYIKYPVMARSFEITNDAIYLGFGVVKGNIYDSGKNQMIIVNDSTYSGKILKVPLY
ncbi:MAG: type II secretion system protein [Bacilli bacterium]|nr:type II secretion system protein [Bacilli bacterium]